MSTVDKAVERLDNLIAKADQMIGNQQSTSHDGFTASVASSGDYHAWKTQSLACLTSIVGVGNEYLENFKAEVKESWLYCVMIGRGILQSVREDLVNGYLEKPPAKNPIQLVEQICLRFHVMARQLRARHGGRPTLDVSDEYDVQDLMHPLLLLFFEDVRAEEYTPSYAGKSSRMDFLLKNEAVVVELKKTRPGLGPKELSTQLIEDIQRYQAHADCSTLVCFVYDPDGYIPNPRGIEADLSRQENSFEVRVLIRP